MTGVPGDNTLWEGPLFGRLTKSAKTFLLRHGWQLRNNTVARGDNAKPSSNRLALAWPNKSGPQFEMNDATAAHIRPYPKHLTDVLDDKVRMADLLLNGGPGTEEILPKHLFSSNDICPGKLYFVKHRHGAQGKNVRVFNSTGLKEWWSTTSNANDFVVQEEVVPQTYQGRKFVLRSHVLLWHSSGNVDSVRPSFHSRVFDSVIVQHHAAVYDPNSVLRSSHISQAGKKHPPPQLLLELPHDHPAVDRFPEIQKASQQIIFAYQRWFDDQFVYDTNTMLSLSMSPETTCFALLGVDWLLQFHRQNNDESKTRLKLCEINSHPALGWGTMSKVPSRVFSDLLEDTLNLLLTESSGRDSVAQD